MFKYEKAVCYSGYRENQGPNINIYPSKEEILEDLNILVKDGYSLIRMYDPSLHAKRVLECIKEYNLDLKVMLGVDLLFEYNNVDCPWVKQDYSQAKLDENKKRNSAEVEKLIELANEYSTVVSYVSAGNEARPFWGDNLVTEDRILEIVQKLKKECPNQKVTYCEGWDIWCGQIEKVLNEVDFVSAHIYPQWNHKNLVESIEYTKEKFLEVKKYCKNKEVIVTEAGWATSCEDKQMIVSDANVESQKTYYREVLDFAKQEDALFFMFEAFDEPWKGGASQKEAEKNWGIYYVNRLKK